jgi:hypothetical protein
MGEININLHSHTKHQTYYIIQKAEICWKGAPLGCYEAKRQLAQGRAAGGLGMSS